MRLDKVTFQNIYKEPSGRENYGKKLFFDRLAPMISPEMVRGLIPIVSEDYFPAEHNQDNKLQYIMFDKGRIGFTTGAVIDMESFKHPQRPQKFNPNYN